MRKLWIAFILLALLLSACGQAAAPTPTSAPAPTEAAEPTQAPEPTEAAEPTQAPEPTEAAEPTQAPEPTEAAETEPTEAAEAGAIPDLGGRELQIGSDTAYPPFESVDETTGEIVGFDVDLLNEICALANCRATFVTAAFDTIFAALAAGEYDAVASAVTITEERAQVVDFTRPYLNAGQIVTVRQGSDITGPQDLQGKRVGVQLGTTGDIAAGEYTSDDLIERYQTIDLAMAALAQGDLDAVIADAPTSADIVSKQFSDQLELVGEPFTSEYYGIAIPKESPELKEAFDAALAEIIASGKLAELAEKWQLPASATENLPESGLSE